jgi:hypothetical protein
LMAWNSVYIVHVFLITCMCILSTDMRLEHVSNEMQNMALEIERLPSMVNSYLRDNSCVFRKSNILNKIGKHWFY